MRLELTPNQKLQQDIRRYILQHHKTPDEIRRVDRYLGIAVMDLLYDFYWLSSACKNIASYCMAIGHSGYNTPPTIVYYTQ